MTPEEVVRKFEKLQGARVNWDSHWEEIADYTVPKKKDVFTKYNKQPGEKKNTHLYDATAIHANELLASALHGMLTNPSVQWFELTTGDPNLDANDKVKAWLQEAVKRIHQVLNNSNFQTEIHEVYLDLGSFGTSSMRIEEDDEMIIRFSSRPIYELYIDENYKGIVDTVFREYSMTGRQILQEFGEKNFPPHQLDAVKKDLMKKWDVIHGVLPSKDAGKKASKKFSSYHVLKELRVMLKESGFFEFPYVIPRWTKISGEIYGRSPAMKALPDIKMINEIMKTTIRAAQKIVDPPLMAPDDGIIMPIRTTPGGLNYYRSGTGDRIEPLETRGRIDLGIQLIESIKVQIRQAFFIDQLQLNEGPQMTATEVMQRTEEKLRLLGPILGRQHFELLKPMIDRIFGIMVRKDLLPQDVPPELEDRELEVQYSSMIARAQRSSEAENFNRVFSFIAPLVELNPSVIDNINFDGTVRKLANIFNLPHEMFNDQEVVDANRQQRQQLEQQQIDQQQQLADAETIQKVSPAMEKMQ